MNRAYEVLGILRDKYSINLAMFYVVTFRRSGELQLQGHLSESVANVIEDAFSTGKWSHKSVLMPEFHVEIDGVDVEFILTAPK